MFTNPLVKAASDDEKTIKISNEILKLAHLENWYIADSDVFKRSQELSEIPHHFKRYHYITSYQVNPKFSLKKLKKEMSFFLELLHDETIAIADRIIIFNLLNASLP